MQSPLYSCYLSAPELDLITHIRQLPPEVQEYLHNFCHAYQAANTPLPDNVVPFHLNTAR